MTDSVIFHSSDKRFSHASIYGERIKSVSLNQVGVLNNTQAQAFASDYIIHKEMIQSSIPSVEATPLVYVRTPMLRTRSSYNSAESNVTASALSYYQKVENSLKELGEDSDEDHRVEKGAVSSALSVVAELRRRDIAPPELSWHGGDAVVMLWALGDTTCAITVTDGEVGYVVRRNKRAVKIADSLALSTFKLEDMR